MIRAALGGGKNGASWQSILPYSPDDLRVHLERQFMPWMSWSNYGDRWHIDHITPVSAFKFDTIHDPEFQACWALSNLRPLAAKKNLQKNATRTYLL